MNVRACLTVNGVEITGAGGGSAFALLSFDWQAEAITAQVNISGSFVTNVGIRRFPFVVPMADPTKAVITATVVPLVDDNQVLEPMTCYATVNPGGTELQVYVYPTQVGIFGSAADYTDGAERVFVRVDEAP